MARPLLSIIIPAHNEAERIPLTLVDIDKRLSERDYSYEIVVVENGSRDNTAEVVRRMQSSVKNLKLIQSPEASKGSAVRLGMLQAKGEYRLFMDADNATTIDHFDRMLPYFKEGYGVVIASRSHKESVLDPPEPLFRELAGKGLNLVVQLLLLPGMWDTQCGFKAFTAEAAERIFNLSRVHGWGFDVEILALAKRLGYRIKEIPVHWVDVAGSKVKFSAGPKFLMDVAKVRWWLWTNVYRLKK